IGRHRVDATLLKDDHTVARGHARVAGGLRDRTGPLHEVAVGRSTFTLDDRVLPWMALGGCPEHPRDVAAALRVRRHLLLSGFETPQVGAPPVPLAHTQMHRARAFLFPPLRDRCGSRPTTQLPEALRTSND